MDLQNAVLVPVSEPAMLSGSAYPSEVIMSRLHQIRKESTMWGGTVGIVGILALGLLFALLTTNAQPSAHIPKVGWLDWGGRAYNAPLHAAFLQGLRELGYVEGQNLVLARRDAEGQLDQLPALAVELVRIPVDVIVTASGVPATRAAMQ